MNEKDRKELIAHILEQSRGQEVPSKPDEFESLLFEERLRQFLLKEGNK
jgi:hypothetical protein